MSVSVAEFVLYWLRQRDAPSHRDDRRHLHKYSLWYSLRVSAVSSEDGAGSGVRGAWLSPDGGCDITPVCHNTDFVVAAVLLSSTSLSSTGSRHTIRPAWLYLAVHSPVIMTGDWCPSHVADMWCRSLPHSVHVMHVNMSTPGLQFLIVAQQDLPKSGPTEFLLHRNEKNFERLFLYRLRENNRESTTGQKQAGELGSFIRQVSNNLMCYESLSSHYDVERCACWQYRLTFSVNKKTAQHSSRLSDWDWPGVFLINWNKAEPREWEDLLFLPFVGLSHTPETSQAVSHQVN